MAKRSAGGSSKTRSTAKETMGVDKRFKKLKRLPRMPFTAEPERLEALRRHADALNAVLSGAERSISFGGNGSATKPK